MSEHAITRRSFLAKSAGAVTLAGLGGYMSFGTWEQAQAADTVQGGGPTRSTPCAMPVPINADSRRMSLTGI